jgi:hypothetical protein
MGYDASGGDMALHITPVTCTPCYMSYLRQTVDPFLDYYVNNTTLEITYMAEGATVAIPLGCTSRSGVSGMANVVSLTKNFEWHPHDRPAILAQLLQAVGIALPDELLVQVGNANEIKVERE